MIDFVKVEVPPEVGRGWTTHPALTFYTPVNLKTGECAPRSEATYRNLLFTITIYPSGRATLAGNLHKLRHGQHNGGDFPAWAVAATVAELAYSFGFRPEEAVLHTLEFGLNVPLLVAATTLLRRAVLYKTLPFNLNHFGGKGYYLEATACQYYLKLYDKQRHLVSGRHLDPGPLLRVELKTKRMEWLAQAGVNTLAYLTKPARLAALGELLATAWHNILFAAVAVPAHLPKAVQRLLREGSHLNYWQILNQGHPASLRKYRQRYRELTAHHVPDALVLAAADAVGHHWEHLRLAAPTLPHLTEPAWQTIPELTNYRLAVGAVNYPGFDLLGIGAETSGIDGAMMRRCQTCGRDISGQAIGARYCSEARYGRAAKKCRNAASNPRHNTRRAVQKIVRECCLFDPLPYVRVRPELRAFVLAGAVPTASPSKKS